MKEKREIRKMECGQLGSISILPDIDDDDFMGFSDDLEDLEDTYTDTIEGVLRLIGSIEYPNLDFAEVQEIVDNPNFDYTLEEVEDNYAEYSA